ADVHRNTSNWIRYTFPTERLFALNAFSMGAWATGTNMGVALSQACMVKSTGPDLDRIVDTIERFGDEFDYLITAYPPFLKHVVARRDVREALLGPGQARVPMVFQYSPLENCIEVSGLGEAVVAVDDISVLSPERRYRVGAAGRTVTRPELVGRLESLGVIEP